MTLLQTIILAITQGITELFPISSVAHAVITPYLLGWNLSPEFLKEHFLPVVVMLHVGTAVALLVFFGRDWIEFAKSLGGRGDPAERRVLIRLIIGTLPAAIIGFVLEKHLRALFANPHSAAIFLMINGVLLFLGEKLRGRGTLRIADLGYLEALYIGLAQALALIPGFSRSGASIIAGCWARLTHEEAARFSMLLATPIIAGAAILELPKLLHQENKEILTSAVIGGVIAGIVAFFSVWALMTWFRKREVNAMFPFAIYCVVIGAITLLV